MPRLNHLVITRHAGRAFIRTEVLLRKFFNLSGLFFGDDEELKVRFFFLFGESSIKRSCDRSRSADVAATLQPQISPLGGSLELAQTKCDCLYNRQGVLPTTLPAETIHRRFLHEMGLSWEAGGRAESSDTRAAPQIPPETQI